MRMGWVFFYSGTMSALTPDAKSITPPPMHRGGSAAANGYRDGDRLNDKDFTIEFILCNLNINSICSFFFCVMYDLRLACWLLQLTTGFYTFLSREYNQFCRLWQDYKQTTEDYRRLQTTVDYNSAAQHIYLLYRLYRHYRHYRHYSSLLQSAEVCGRLRKVARDLLM